MNGRDFPFLPLLLLFAMVYGAYWLYQNVEIVEDEFSVDLSFEAKENPHLAASRLLGTEGFKPSVATDRSVFNSLDIDSVGVLWLSSLSQILDDREAAKVRSWVESGGILLASPAGELDETASSAHGLFLKQVGIVAVDEADRKTDDYKQSYVNETFELQLPDDNFYEAPLVLAASNRPYFKLDLASAASNVSNILDSWHVIINKVGEGQVAVYSNETQFENNFIDNYDEPYLLTWLTEPAKSKVIYLVHGLEEHPGLLATLWRFFPLTICLIGLVLVAFLRWASTRLGPIEQEVAPTQNNLMAHLQARGEFWQRHKHTSRIVSDIQQATLEKLNPVASSDKANHQAVAIKRAASLLNLSEREAEQLLTGQSASDKQILHKAKMLQKLNYNSRNKPKKST